MDLPLIQKITDPLDSYLVENRFKLASSEEEDLVRFAKYSRGPLLVGYEIDVKKLREHFTDQTPKSVVDFSLTISLEGTILRTLNPRKNLREPKGPDNLWESTAITQNQLWTYTHQTIIPVLNPFLRDN